MVIFSANIFAQNDPMTNFFKKYAGNELFTKVTISSKMFSMFTHFEPNDPNEKEMMKALSKLKSIRILSADSIPNGKKYFSEAMSSIKGTKFEELMSVVDGTTDMQFMVQETGGKISELLMLVGGSNKFYMLSLHGDIDLKQISKLSENMKISGLEHLNKVGGNGKKKE